MRRVVWQFRAGAHHAMSKNIGCFTIVVAVCGIALLEGLVLMIVHFVLKFW